MMNFSFDQSIGKIKLDETMLTDGETKKLLAVLTHYLLYTHNEDIQARLRQTLAASFTMIFPETQKICENEIRQRYGVSLGLFVEDSQTAYNIHQRGCKSDS